LKGLQEDRTKFRGVGHGFDNHASRIAATGMLSVTAVIFTASKISAQMFLLALSNMKFIKTG